MKVCSVAVVGVGGIGSHFMDHINQLVGARQLKGWNFTIFDDDTVEPKNLLYQKFEDCQMGQPKVDAVYDNSLNIEKLTPNNRRVEPKELISFDVVICCVDSGPWRHAFFKEMFKANARPYWIDLRSEGRIVAAYTKHKSNTEDVMLATVKDSKQTAGSCQLKHELDNDIVQVGNRIIALVGVQFLLNFSREDANVATFNQRF